MVLTHEIRAIRKFGPGYFIREQMELRDWTQEDLAEVMGITVKHLNRILQDKQPLTLEMARVLSEVFKNSPQYWVNLDTGYRLWLEQDKSQSEVDAEIKSVIYERMPIKDMVKKGWLKQSATASKLKSQVLDFWGWEKFDFNQLDTQYLPYLTRKSEAYAQFNTSYAITWYRKALLEAEKFDYPAYDRRKLEALYEDMHAFTVEPKGINKFISRLADAGVIFFVLPHLQKTYLDGAAFYSGNNPVVVYTGRYKRIDNFWFTIAHEIAHILLHINKQTPFVLDNLRDKNVDALEKEANELAAEKLKHTEILKYLEPYLGYLYSSKVEKCAELYQVHPAIIIGKLAHDKKISYGNQSLYNEDVLQHIAKKYQIVHE